MSPNARNHCIAAMNLIHANEHGAAILNLRSALRECNNPRAWSKLMLAIRKLSRIEPVNAASQYDCGGEDDWPSSDAEIIARNW